MNGDTKMTGTYRWEVAHERDGDDRDYAEHIDHVDRGRAVSRRCHIACTNLQINGRHQKCISFLGTSSRRSTHGQLQVHEDRRRYWQDVVRIRNRKIGEERDAAPMELFERESAQALDAEEHPERDGQLHER